MNLIKDNNKFYHFYGFLCVSGSHSKLVCFLFKIGLPIFLNFFFFLYLAQGIDLDLGLSADNYYDKD